MLLGAVAALFTFMAVSFIVFGLTNKSTATQADLLEARLSQFNETGRQVLSLSEAELSLPFTDRVIKPVFDKLGKIMSRRMQGGQQQAIQEKLNLAGRPGGLTAGGFVALQVIAMVIGVALGIGLVVLVSLTPPTSYLAPVAGAVLGYLVPSMTIARKIKKRQKEILLALPSALDLLTISVEAGLAFDAALARVTDKYRNVLASEFNQVLNEVRLGRPRLEALDDMGRRNKVEELNNFLQAIIQSEQLGVGIANVLRIQSEEIRRRRRQRAEEAGQKAPIKMLIPMIGCIFPTLFIVLLGPAVIQVSKSFH
ncbi:MAG: type II secretion system F family protein [Candidatus Dormibacteraeota bacterium]|uniref:Type II secretion system F family protein n=1 Tax=Candidatus Aeolococcus gillhamiae TaxID=3127015 RepID=A0A2W5ZDJ5_9BACT|nr:type II secretion system F family protein [Candidatus Dormibacteraeota bacterium]PZR83413.1 MAG: type II secretion system protein [Candidatus Dormibacter sp. RRmetagenome_bin12]